MRARIRNWIVGHLVAMTGPEMIHSERASRAVGAALDAEESRTL